MPSCVKKDSERSEKKNLNFDTFKIMSRILTVIGLLLMLHSAISIGQFRGIIRERGGTEFNIPSDILIEVPPLILFPV